MNTQRSVAKHREREEEQRERTRWCRATCVVRLGQRAPQGRPLAVWVVAVQHGENYEDIIHRYPWNGHQHLALRGGGGHRKAFEKEAAGCRQVAQRLPCACCPGRKVGSSRRRGAWWPPIGCRCLPLAEARHSFSMPCCCDT